MIGRVLRLVFDYAVEQQIVEEERPPMLEIPAYRRKFGANPPDAAPG